MVGSTNHQVDMPLILVGTVIPDQGLRLIHKERHMASSTELRAGKMVRPTSNAKGFGRNGARNFNHASIPEIANTNPNHMVASRRRRMLLVAVVSPVEGVEKFAPVRIHLGINTNPIPLYNPNSIRFVLINL
jgi:hypothetical protein